MVALIFMIAMGLSLASYMSLVSFNLRSSHRSLNSAAAVNLAELGVEEALWNINAFNDPARIGASFVSLPKAIWTKTGDNATGVFTNYFTADSAAQNLLTIYIEGFSQPDPKIRVHSRLTMTDSSTVEKWVQVKAKTATNSVPGTNNTNTSSGPAHIGLVARNQIKFSGTNASVDSWNSAMNPDGSAALIPIPYSPSIRNDRGFVGSISSTVDIVGVQNADIFGYASSAPANGTTPSTDALHGISYGPNGSILAKDSPAGTQIDTRRVSNDFVANLPMPAGPNINGYNIGGINNVTSLPRAGDAPASDGKYYYTASSISVAGGNNNPKNVNITSGDVILKVTGDISFSGQSSLNISTGASLEVFAAQNVDLTGNGVANGTNTTSSSTVQSPIKFKLWGTGVASGSTPYTVKVAGNGVLSGVVYAPAANVQINGNGDILGSVVGNNITLVGNAAFHYDESLSDWVGGKNTSGTASESTSGKRFTIANWRELTANNERTALF